MRRNGDRLALPTARGAPLTLSPLVRGLGYDPGLDRRWLTRRKRPWAIDLFSGAGGLSLGLHEAGFDVIASADADERAAETHAANVPGLSWALDLAEPDEFIKRLRDRGVESVDLVAGGPPCQPFSRAGSAKLRSLIAEGRRGTSDPRVGLWNTFLAVVDAFSPRAVLLENVPDMARWGEGEILVSLMSALRDRGLEPEARVLNAWEYGIPQHRARLFVVATRGSQFCWPRRRPLVTLHDAIGDLPPIPPAQRERALPYPGSPTTPFQARARRRLTGEDARTIWDHCSRDVRKDDAEAFALLDQGGTYADLPQRLRRYRSDIFDDKYKRLAWNQVARTITAHIAKDGYWYIHPDQERTLSIREAARIQTFPDRFRFAGHPSVQLRQIGNAVPPALARAVGVRVIAALNDPPAKQMSPPQLRAWRVPHDLVDPWLASRNAWLVLAGELTLRRTPPPVRSAGLRLLAQCDGPQAFLDSIETLGAELVALGVARSRLLRLEMVARALVEHFGGDVPSDERDLMHLPSVGQSVSALVCCFGHNQRAVFLDAATKRLVARASGNASSSAWSTRLELYRMAGSEGPDREFNLRVRAVAEACCRSRQPLCQDCPLRAVCHWRRSRTAVRASDSVTT